MCDSGPADQYIELIQSFLACEISARESEAAYLSLFASDDEQPEALYPILGTLFSDVDAFCDVAEIFDAQIDIDEQELRRRAKVALDGLQAIRRSDPR